LIEGVLEFGDLRALGGGGEDDEIEVGIRAGGAFEAGAASPDGDAGEVDQGDCGTANPANPAKGELLTLIDVQADTCNGS
jgi:hypothetical protein